MEGEKSWWGVLAEKSLGQAGKSCGRCEGVQGPNYTKSP